MQSFLNLSLSIAAFITGLQLLTTIPQADNVQTSSSQGTSASFDLLPDDGDELTNNPLNRSATTVPVVNNSGKMQNNQTVTNHTNQTQQQLTQEVGIGGLKLRSTPKLNFGKIGISAIYQGSSVALSNSIKKTFAPVTVSDYRGYSPNYRGWSVMAQLSGFSNGVASLTPTMTLKLYEDKPHPQIIRSVVINAQTATTVLSSQTLPTNGVRVISAFTSEASALNFDNLSQKQRNNFIPGTYHGSIIWTLSNTAASD